MFAIYKRAAIAIFRHQFGLPATALFSKLFQTTPPLAARSMPTTAPIATGSVSAHSQRKAQAYDSTFSIDVSNNKNNAAPPLRYAQEDIQTMRGAIFQGSHMIFRSHNSNMDKPSRHAGFSGHSPQHTPATRKDYAFRGAQSINSSFICDSLNNNNNPNAAPYRLPDEDHTGEGGVFRNASIISNAGNNNINYNPQGPEGIAINAAAHAMTAMITQAMMRSANALQSTARPAKSPSKTRRLKW